MKVFFLLTLILSTQTMAAGKTEQCLTDMVNFRLGVKMRGYLEDMRRGITNSEDPEQDIYYSKQTPQEVCSKLSSESKEEFETLRASLTKVRTGLLKELTEKKKITSPTYGALFHDSDRAQITEADVCSDANEHMTPPENGPCDINQYNIQSYVKGGLLSGSAADVCAKTLASLRSDQKEARVCFDNNEAKKELAKKAPKGDGISPDVPAPKAPISTTAPVREVKKLSNGHSSGTKASAQ